MERWFVDCDQLPSMVSYADVDRAYAGKPFVSAQKLFIHQSLKWAADDYIGWAQSRGGVKEWLAQTALPATLTRQREAVTSLIRSRFGTAEVDVIFSYTVRVFQRA